MFIDQLRNTWKKLAQIVSSPIHCQSHKHNQPKPAELRLSELESRIMYDASPLAVVLEGTSVDGLDADILSLSVEPGHFYPTDGDLLVKTIDQLYGFEDTDIFNIPASVTTNDAETNLERNAVLISESEDAVSTITEIIFIDSSVAEYETVLQNLLIDISQSINVVVLETNRDGIEQISETLENQSDLTAVHVISHGNDGRLQLGNTLVNHATMDTYSEQISQWSAALSEDADVLFYGCDLAGSSDGKELVDLFATLTGADVAASEDPTGNSKLGGDWDLEYTTGSIESEVAISHSAQIAFHGILAAPVANSDTYEVNGITTLTVDTTNSLTQHIITTSADFPRSTATGDLDGDGDLDIVVSNSFPTDSIEWYENDGSGSFVVHTIDTGVDDPYEVITSDVDGDGDLDVVTTSAGTNQIKWYENNGSGVFTAHTVANDASGIRGVAAKDVDGDGDMDLLSAETSGDRIAWFENNGSESFTRRNIDTLADGALAVTAADLDDDGDIDVLAANFADDQIVWYENNGSESFTKHTVASGIDGAWDVTTADVDGDGDLDVLSAALNGNTISWHENDGSENFTQHVIITTTTATSVTVADIDGDGNLDVLTASQSDDTVAWHQNDGSGNFTTRILTTSADGAKDVEVADVDGDGDLDVIAASANDSTIAWYENDQLSVLANDADADPNDSLTAVLVSGPSHASSFTFNADGTFSYTHDGSLNPSDSFTYKVNDGTMDSGTVTVTLNIEPVNDAPVVGAPGSALIATEQTNLAIHGTGFTVSDVDEAGGGAIATLSVGEGTLTVTAGDSGIAIDSGNGTGMVVVSGIIAQIDNLLTGTGTGTITYFNNLDAPSASTTLTVTVNDQGNTGTDPGLTGDGSSEEGTNNVAINISAINDAPVNLFLAYNFTGHNVATSTGVAEEVFIIDLDGDGDLDVLGASTIDRFAWYENDGSQNFTEHTIYTTTNFPRSIYATDIDGDGDIDILTGDSGIDTVVWHENDGNENFTAHVVSSGTPDGPYSVSVTDMDSDGDMDFLVVFDNDNTVTWYENDGSQNFTAHDITVSATGPHSIFAADLDSDGDMDVVSANRLGDNVVWYENDGSQNFTTHAIASGGSSRSVRVTDMDGDGDLDVLAAVGTTVTWYENDGSQNFTAHNITTSASLVFSVFEIDMDGDGDIDVVSADRIGDTVAWYENDGSENFTERIVTTTVDGPQSVFAADVDGDGDVDLFVANYDAQSFTWYENRTSATPPSQITNVNTALVFNAANGNQLAISDPDSGANTVEVTLTASNGTVTLTGTTGLTFTTGDGTADTVMTFTGTLDSINTALDGLSFDPTPAFEGLATLKIDTDDLGNTGSGGNLVDSDTINITVSDGVNDAPIVGAPGSALAATEQTNLAIHGTGFTVSDIDEAGGGTTTTLSVGEGIVTVVVGDSGVSIDSGNGTNTVVLNGTIAQIDHLLTGAGTGTITYLNNSDSPSASTTLTVTVNDQGNTGTDPGLSGDGTSEEGTSNVAINITAVNDAPTDIDIATDAHNVSDNPITIIGSQTGSQDTSAVLAEGNTVVVTDNGIDIHAEVFDAQGNSITGSYQIFDGRTFSSSSGNGDNPVVKALPTGGFVVAIEARGYVASGYFGEAIIVLAFDADGNQITLTPNQGSSGAVLVSGSTGSNGGNTHQVTPTLDVAGDGTITVSWNNTTVGQFEERSFNILGPVVAENAPTGTLITTLSGVDPDGDVLTYSIVGGDSNFEIVDNEIRVKAGASLDYETATSHNLTIRATDTGSLTYDEAFTITVTNVNEAPVISNLSGDALAYTEGDGAVVIEQGTDALVSDVDTSAFDSGTLTVSFQAGSDNAEDVLAIQNQGTGAGQIGVSGSNVTYQGVTIGTFTGGTGGTDLVITLNASADAAAVSALTQNITYENTDTDNPTTGAPHRALCVDGWRWWNQCEL